MKKIVLTFIILGSHVAAGSDSPIWVEDVRVENRAFLSETLGGWSAILGTNARASEIDDNRVNFTDNGSDGAAAIELGYHSGISFYAYDPYPSTVTAGNKFFTNLDTQYRVMRMQSNGVVTIGPIAEGAAWDPRHKLQIRDNSSIADDSLTSIVLKGVNADKDLNYEAGVMVTHDNGYSQTPGYGGTTQFYSTAGSQGTVLGNNSYVNSAASDYDYGEHAPTAEDVPDGFVRIELGPVWPYSEKGRWNNRGDYLAGKQLVRKHTDGTQSGTEVTASSGFVSTDVGKFIAWGDLESGGIKAYVDRIISQTNSTTVVVETSRNISTSQALRVVAFNTVLTPDGDLTLAGDVTVGGGTAMSRVLSGSGSIDFSRMAVGAEVSQTVTVTGAATTGTPSVALGWSGSLETGIDVVQAWVSSSNTVTIRVRNNSRILIDPASLTVRATVTSF